MTEREGMKKAKFLFFVTAVISALIAAAPFAEAAFTSPFEAAAARAFDHARNEATRERDAFRGRVLGGVAPHHDLAIEMIARFYAEIASPRVRRVWLLSPDHFRRAQNYAAVCGEDWTTAAGTLHADRLAKSGFERMKIVEVNSGFFVYEHGITIHIPFIARAFPNASIVPMVLKSNIPDVALLTLKNFMMKNIGDGDAVILSMDLSHYKTPEAMAAEDERTLAVLTNLEPMKTDGLDVDARRAASLVLRLFRELGAERGTMLEHTDSSALLGRRVESGTSYATIVYQCSMNINNESRDVFRRAAYRNLATNTQVSSLNKDRDVVVHRPDTPPISEE
jgi:AmmeMemoRadiSam system protein B